MSDLMKIDSISKRNGDVKCYALDTNMIEARTGKNGWGHIKVAVDNETITEMFARDPYTGALYLVNRVEFEKESEEVDRGNADTQRDCQETTKQGVGVPKEERKSFNI